MRLTGTAKIALLCLCVGGLAIVAPRINSNHTPEDVYKAGQGRAATFRGTITPSGFAGGPGEVTVTWQGDNGTTEQVTAIAPQYDPATISSSLKGSGMIEMAKVGGATSYRILAFYPDSPVADICNYTNDSTLVVEGGIEYLTGIAPDGNECFTPTDR